MNAIPKAITPSPHTNLLNVYIQIANKMGFQPKKIYTHTSEQSILGPYLNSIPNFRTGASVNRARLYLLSSLHDTPTVAQLPSTLPYPIKPTKLLKIQFCIIPCSLRTAHKPQLDTQIFT
jgi:hypothetical protein